MIDLNELAYFAKVVDFGGFAPAARALGMQRSKLSRRIAKLEQRLDVRLIQRSTRRFVVTEIGRTYYRHCVAMLVEAEAAQQVIDAVRSEPAGLVRLACPPDLLAYRMGEAIADFMAAYPKVEIRLEAISRPVDPLVEGFDVVIRTGELRGVDQTLVARRLGEISQCLVASPDLLARLPPLTAPRDLEGLPAIAVGLPDAFDDDDGCEWAFSTATAEAVVRVRARFVADDLSAVRAAARTGIGVVCLPNLMIERDLREGRLVRVLSDWQLPGIRVSAMFPSRRGLLPSVRALIDHLAADCEPYREESR